MIPNPIWFNKSLTLEHLTFQHHTNHIGAFLGIAFTQIGPDFLTATMPVNERTRQPLGILHGGSSVVLAESMGSVASALVIDPQEFVPVGLEVNANHLRPVSKGLVTGTCQPIRLGRSIHVWEIKLVDGEGKMNCISRLTVSIVEKSRLNI